MDSLTHIAVGAVIGELVAGKELGKKAVLWGGFIAALPDIDVLFQWLFSPGSSLLFHRGVSHSLVFCVLACFLLARWLNRRYKGDKNTYKVWVKLAGFTYLSHLLLDVLNTYGAAILWPLNVRVAFDSMAVADILFSLPFILACLLFVVFRRNLQLRKAVATATLVIGGTYLLFSATNKLYLEHTARKTLLAEGHSVARVRATPLPLSSFVWKVLAEDSKHNGFWQANHSITSGSPLNFTYIGSKEYKAAVFENDKEFKRLKRFSKGMYAIAEDENGNTFFCDLRFSSFDFDGTGSPISAVIKFELKTNPQGGLALEKSYPKRTIDRERLRRYYNQIKGNT